MTLPATFWNKTRQSDCITWYGAINSKGYGCFSVGGVSTLVHRIAWEDVHGPIPEGLTIDHKCRVRNCVNVDHMEIVSIAENNRRKKAAHGLVIGGTCIRDHLIDEANIYRHPRGHIECRKCRNEARKAARKPSFDVDAAIAFIRRESA